MPSSPKIAKETILEAALKMLIRDGYSAINIKTIAKELGCSTQPISRQFGSMDGLRGELFDYCLGYLKDSFQIKGDNVLEIIMGIAQGYIDLAWDYPNLYKYLYMSEQDGEKLRALARSLRESKHDNVIHMIEMEYEISDEAANKYIRNMDFYVRGIASCVVADSFGKSKDEIMEIIYNANRAFIAQAKE